MDKPNPAEEKKSDGDANVQKPPDTAEGNTLPTFINNWAPLPSTASGTSALGMGSTLNLNLPNFYQGSGGSVISGPPLLGGSMPPSSSTGANGSTGMSTNIRPEYLNMSAQSKSVNQRALPVAPAMNTLGTDASGQRSHSNSFNGFSYSQHAYGTATGMPNTSGNLSSTGGLATNHIDFMNINNSPPLLSSASATSSGMFLTNLPGKGSDNMNMLNHQNIYSNMHGILPAGSASYTNLTAYGNSSNPVQEGMTGAPHASNIGAKRPQPAPITHNTMAATATGSASKKAKGAANRSRAASTAAPAMDTQLAGSQPLVGAAQPLQQQQLQYNPNNIAVSTVSGAMAAGARGVNPTSPVFDSSMVYSAPSGGVGGSVGTGGTAPVQLLPQTTSTNTSSSTMSNNTSNSNNISANPPNATINTAGNPTMPPGTAHNPVKLTGPAPPSSATITYPIMAAYKSSSVMSTGLVSNYVPGGPNYSTTTSLHPGQGMPNYVYSNNSTGNVSSTAQNNTSYVGSVGAMGSNVNMQSMPNQTMNTIANSKLSSNNLLNQNTTSDGTNRTYSYLPGNAANTGSNVSYQQQMYPPLGQGNVPNQQLSTSHGSSQHVQYTNNSGPNNLSYGGPTSTPGMNYGQQQPQLQQPLHNSQHQQQNTYLRPQPMLHNSSGNMSNTTMQQGSQLPLTSGNMYNTGIANNNTMGSVVGPAGGGGNGGAVQLQNYPLNTMHGQGHMNTTYNTGMNMSNTINNNMPMNYNTLNNNNNNTAQQQHQQQAANNKAAPARARVRNKTPRPGKKALAGSATGPGDADGPPSSVTDANNPSSGATATRPMTYKEKRAASSKKAIAAAAAAAAAEAERNGDPNAASLLMQQHADSRRRDTKRDRDNSLVEGEAGRSEREKAEKEESTTALLKRREPIVSRIEDIEDSKFLGRKGPGFVPPAISSVPSLLAQAVKSEEGWGDTQEKATVQARGLREDGQRPKTHWDYVLQEVQWMALDFRQEFRWKVAASQRAAAACASTNSRCVLSPRAVKVSLADAAQARAVAKTLAQQVAAFWHHWSDKVTKSCDQATGLRGLLTGALALSECLTDSDHENVKPENISKLTDKILSLPTTIRSSDAGASQEDASTVISTTEKGKSAFFHAAPVSSSGDALVALLPHQLTALEHINALNAEKFGAVMHGKAYIGKTTAGCALVKEWLRRTDNTDNNKVVPVVVVVAERRCVFRWATELRSQQLPQVEVWSAPISADAVLAEEEVAPEGRVIIVSCDLLNSFLQSARFEKMGGQIHESTESVGMDVDGSEEPASTRWMLQGVLVDRRCVSENSFSSSTLLCNRDKQSVLRQLAARLDAHLTRRCLIVEDAYIPGNVLESLNFLTPGTHYRDWAAKYPSAVTASSSAAGGEKDAENHQQQIVSNTLNQLLSNLTVAMKLPNNADSVIAAQTRLEVVAPEMDSVQARLYYAVASHLARHPSICSGESTTKFAAALLLLQKTCFHAALLTHRGRGAAPSRHIYPEARFDDAQRSELDNPDMYARTGGSSFAPNINALPMRSPPSYDLYWSNPGGEKGPGNQTPVSMDYTYQESTFSRGVLRAHDLSSTGSEDMLDQGSCKLQGLQRLLRRFAGLRVAVLIDTEDECALVSQLLKKLNVQHEVAFASSGSEDGTVDSQHQHRTAEVAGHWVASQKAVQEFNSPLNDTCVLLCSKHVFQPPNVPPQQADAVVILSDDWTQSTEVRDCFRLRLLSAGPTGPPLTVVRVAAGGTIEERMARKGCSLLQLQGTPSTQLWTGVRYSPALGSLPTATAINPNSHLACPEPTLLSQAPMLVLPVAPKTLLGNAASPAPAGSLADGARPGSDRSGSPLVTAADAESANKRNSDSNLRGKGKGFIVQGRQGSTTFVKDNGPLQSLGLSRNRAGVLPEASLWSQRLRRDVSAVLRQFNSRDCTITIFSSGNVFFSADLASTKPTSIGENTIDNHDGHDDTANNNVSCEEIKRMLHCVFDQFVLGQAAALTPDTGSGLANKALQSRLLCMLETQLAMRFEEGNEATKASDEIVEGTATVLAPRRSFGPLELQRLVASGLGKSEAEDALSRLMLPYQYDSLLPLDCYKIKAEVDASQHWPQSFLVFRDLLSEARREGTVVDPVLFVNPLQTAHRGETIGADAFQRTKLPSDSAISIKYLAEGARNVSGASRSSKSRRSRPSAGASRRKDSVTSTNTAENADVSNVPVKAEGEADIKAQASAEVTFEVGFLSDLEPSGDTPQKAPAAAPVPLRAQTTPLEKSPNPVQENSTIDSWHPTEDDIIICTQNAFSDTHFKRTENWLNRALEQSRRRRRTAAEARLRYTWLCTTGRTQQRLQDPLVVAQIEQLRFSVQQRLAAAAAATTTTGVSGATGASPSVASQLNSPYGSELNLVVAGGAGTPSFYPYPTNTNATTFASPQVESSQKQAGNNPENPDGSSGVLF